MSGLLVVSGEASGDRAAAAYDKNFGTKTADAGQDQIAARRSDQGHSLDRK